jgi:hypothetical protein
VIIRVAVTVALVLLAIAPEARAQRKQPRLDNDAARMMMAYVKLDTEGAALSDEGWRELVALCTRPAPRPTGEIAVYEELDVFDSIVEPGSDRAIVGVQGRGFGYYNPRTGRYRTDGFPGPIFTKGDLAVVRVDGRWRIDGGPPPPALTWQTVLRHATTLRDTTTDSKVKRHATLTVRALERYH